MPNLPLCHWSGQSFDLHVLLSTDIPVLLLNQPSIKIRPVLKSSDAWEVSQGHSLIWPRQVCVTEYENSVFRNLSSQYTISVLKDLCLFRLEAFMGVWTLATSSLRFCYNNLLQKSLFHDLIMFYLWLNLY